MKTDNDPISHHCEECSEKLNGRIDKRFCNDLCRTSFNNRRRQKEAAIDPQFIQEIPKIILKNYRILHKLSAGEKITVKKSMLEKQGFNFKFMTSYYTTLDGDTYHFCFDLGYLPIKSDRILIVNQPSQIEI